MSIDNPYDKIAAYYDLEHRSFTEDIALYLQFVEATGGPVLELGCGTGRIVRALAEKGYQVTGVDSSASMLQIARANLAEAQLDQFVALIDGDFLDPDLTQDERYGAVIIAIDSLLHATSAAAQIELLRVAHRNLAEGGILLVDILHPTPGHLLNLDSSLTFAGTWSTDDGSKLDKLVAQSTDIAEQIIASEIWYEVTAGNGTVRRVRTAFEQRWIGSGELELMLQIAGFTRWQIYGSYELDPLDASSNRMIVAAEKPRID